MGMTGLPHGREFYLSQASRHESSKHEIVKSTEGDLQRDGITQAKAQRLQKQAEIGVT